MLSVLIEWLIGCVIVIISFVFGAISTIVMRLSIFYALDLLDLFPATSNTSAVGQSSLKVLL